MGLSPQWDNSIVDDVITVSDAEASLTKELLGKTEDVFVGYSAGANVAAAMKHLEQVNKDDYCVATILWRHRIQILTSSRHGISVRLGFKVLSYHTQPNTKFMKRLKLISVALFLFAVVNLHAQPYATWDKQTLTLDNGVVKR